MLKRVCDRLYILLFNTRFMAIRNTRKRYKSKAFRSFPRTVGLHLSAAARDNTKDDIDEKVREREREKDVKVRSIK